VILLTLIVNLIVISSVAWMGWKKTDHPLQIFYWPAFILKLLGGICVGLIYKYYYVTGDTLMYYHDGTMLASLAREDPAMYFKFLWRGDETFDVWKSLSYIESRALFMVKFTSVIDLLTADNYWVATLYFSLLSFLSSWNLVRVVVRQIPRALFPVAMSFLFVPSVVLWSSGLIKESLALASLFFLSTLAFKLWFKLQLKYWEWIMIPISIWVLWNLKYYYLAVFFPVATASLISQMLFAGYLRSKALAIKIIVWNTLLLLPLIGISLVHPNFYPEVFLEVIVSNYNAFHSISAPGDVISFVDLQPTVASVLRHAPWALVSGLLRPFPWEAGNVFQIILAAENVLIFLLSITSLTRLVNDVHSQYRLLLFTLFVYSVGLCLFLTLSTPNFGTLSRYRVGFLPYYFLLITVDNPVVMRLSRFAQRNSRYLVR